MNKKEQKNICPICEKGMKRKIGKNFFLVSKCGNCGFIMFSKNVLNFEGGK